MDTLPGIGLTLYASVETEVHFVTECNANDEERKSMYADLRGKVDTTNLKYLGQ